MSTSPLIGVALCAALTFAFPGSAEADDAKLTARLDALFAETYKDDQPGASVLVQKGDQVLLRKGYGLADLELAVPIEPDMIFRIGSITKQFTAVGILKLVEEGKLKLDHTLAEMLPDYPDVYDGRVTLRHLLSHTSGIPSYTSMPEFWERAKEDYSVEEMLDYFDEEDLEFEPGSRFVYNNSGYFLLGAIIEEVSGRSYAEFMATELFEPLGLSSTSYDDPRRVVPRRVEGYQFTGEEYRVADYISMDGPYAAGALLSTVDDLARWTDALEAVYLGGEGPVTRATLEKMWTEDQLTDGSGTGYGFGWLLGELQGSRVIHHGGGIHGFTTYALWLPEEDVFVAVLQNGFPVQPSMPAVKAAGLVLGKPFVRRQAKIGTDMLRRLEGIYRIDDETERLVRLEDSMLTTQRTGGQKVTALPMSSTEFFYEDTLTTISFELDDRGNPVAMLMKPWDSKAERAERLDKALPEPAGGIDLSKEQIARLAGTYQLAPSFLLEIRPGDEDGSVVIQATGQPTVPVLAKSPTELFNEDIGARIVFEMEEGAERASKLTLFQAGQTIPAPRIE